MAENDPAKVDTVIEIGITPNRPDALGVRGIARDLAARGLGTLKARDADPIKGTFPCPISVSIDEDTLEQAPVFCGRVVRGVKNGPSPAWLKDCLKAIGLRPISHWSISPTSLPMIAIVRCTSLTQIRLQVMPARAPRGRGETFKALDEKEYTLIEGMTAISDANGVESLAGIMGGEHSGCTDETTNVFIEAAFFDPVRTA